MTHIYLAGSDGRGRVKERRARLILLSPLHPCAARGHIQLNKQDECRIFPPPVKCKASPLAAVKNAKTIPENLIMKSPPPLPSSLPHSLYSTSPYTPLLSPPCNVLFVKNTCTGIVQPERKRRGQRERQIM